MALSVGIVNIEYDHNPPRTVRDFFGDMVSNPDIDVLNDGESAGYWSGEMDEAGMLDLFQDELTPLAENWCSDRSMTDAQRDELLGWLANLPWRYGSIRLHLVF